MHPIERLGSPIIVGLSSAELKELVRTLVPDTNGKQVKLFSLYGLTGTNVAYMTREESVAFLLNSDTSFKARLDSAEKPSEPATEKPNTDKTSQAGSLITQALELLNPGSASTEEKLRSYIDAQLASLTEKLAARRIEVVSQDIIREVTGVTHARFELVLKAVTANVPVALVGPAGGGKTTVCDQVGEALGLQVRPMSFNPLSSKSDLLGYRDANGTYHATLFRECFEQGGIFVADEFDASNPGVATILNAAIANRKCSFADNVTVTAHPNFRAIVCMNTYGTGATVQYVGRNRLDAATLDRFAFIWLEYCQWLEAQLIHASELRKQHMPDYSENPVRDSDHWLSVVRNYRTAADKLGLRHIISPRASILGMKLAEQGIGVRWLTPMLLTKGLQGEDLANLEREALSQ